MVRSIGLNIAIGVFVFATAAAANDGEAPSSPAKRDFGLHEACFGDHYESDEDMKTGNELTVEEILDLLNNPGS